MDNPRQSHKSHGRCNGSFKHRAKNDSAHSALRFAEKWQKGDQIAE